MEQIERRTAEILVSISMFQLLVHVTVCSTFRDGQSGAPLVAENVQADAAVRVDIGVVDAGGEVDLGGLEGVVGGEVYRKEEDTARVWAFTLQDLLVTVLVRWTQTCHRHVMDQKGIILLTGPMMVACQWNCTAELSAPFLHRYNLLSTSIASPLSLSIISNRHTRSSPIGPAEHEEGGSL